MIHSGTSIQSKNVVLGLTSRVVCIASALLVIFNEIPRTRIKALKGGYIAQDKEEDRGRAVRTEVCGDGDWSCIRDIANLDLGV